MANFLKSLFVKGIEIDPAGATSAQVLSYNGTKFAPVTNSATATTSATDLTSGTLDNARLPAAATTITTVGTLGSLAVTNGVTAATFTGALIGNASTATNVAYTGLTGTVTTWNQNTTGTAATVTGAAQSAITSVGTLSSLAVTGDLTVDTTTLKVDSTNNRVGVNTASPVTAVDVVGTATVRAAATQDGVALAGRAGGTSTYEVTLTPTTLTADRTLTLPNASGTVALTDSAMTSSTFIGTTSVALNRSSGALTLAGITLTTPVLGVATGTSFTGTASNHQNNFVKLSASANDSTTMWGYTGGAAAYANLRTYCQFDVGVSWISNGSTGPSGYTPNAHAVFMAGTTISGDIRSSATNTTTYSTSSDYRLKENITEINDAIERIRRLRPVSFQFKDPNNDIVYDGFLAHEVQEVISYAVGGQKDAVTADGEIMPQMIDMSTMVGLLTAGIKELDARLAQLETI